MTPRPVSPLASALALALIVAGLLAWAWVGDWRLAATGLGLGIVAAAVVPAIGRR